MPSGKSLELALRIRTDLAQGQRDIAALEAAIADVGKSATSTSTQLNRVNETVEGVGQAAATTSTQIDRVSDLQAEVDRAFSEQSRQENSIQAQQQAGLISEIGARQQIIDLHARTAAEIEKLLPKMTELAAVTGDPAAIERLKKLKAELEDLQRETGALETALKNGFEGGLTDAVQGLAKGTMDLRDAAAAFAEGISDSLLRLASQNIAEEAFAGLKGMFGGTSAAAEQAIASIQSVQATKLAADQAMTVSSVTATQATAATQTAAATETAAAWTPAAIAASIGSFGGAAAIGLAAVVAALAFQAFARGGHVRGPGTTTSDSIPALLSDQEFVTRAAVVTQPGALPFLEDFNRRGMSALADWSSAVRHATGGLAGVPAPEMPAPGAGITRLAEPAQPAPVDVKNNFRFLTLFDTDDLARRVGASPATERSVLNIISSNPSAIREALGI